MNVVFTEADGTERRWDGFKPDRLMSTEAEAIEKVTGMTFGEWGQALMNGGASASRALVWVLKKREDPPLRYKAVDFPVGDLLVSLDDDEKDKVRAELRRNPDLTDEERRQVMLALGQDDLEGLDYDPAAADTDGPGNVPAPEASGSAPA